MRNIIITTTAVLLALASPALASKAKISGTTGTSTFGNTQTSGVASGLHHNGIGVGGAGSLTTAGASANVGGGGSLNAKGKLTGNVGGQLSAGSTSVSSAGSLVLGTGYAANSTSGSSGSGATIGLKIKKN